MQAVGSVGVRIPFFFFFFPCLIGNLTEGMNFDAMFGCRD
jgi:hypothetical protein